MKPIRTEAIVSDEKVSLFQRNKMVSTRERNVPTLLASDFLRRKFSSQAGFTLIELLVVIAIIAFLMAILLPTLGRVIRQAKAVGCQSNLKQWGTLWATATAENDGYLPGCRPGDRLPEDYPWWGLGWWGWG